jgi:hypothetical protein
MLGTSRLKVRLWTEDFMCAAVTIFGMCNSVRKLEGSCHSERTWGWKQRNSHFWSRYQVTGSRDRIVGIATSYGLDDRGVRVRVPVGSRIFSSPDHPDRLWGPPNLLSNGYRGFFPRGSSGRGVKLTTHLQLVPRSRKCGSIHPLPYAFMT